MMGCSDTDYEYLRKVVMKQSANVVDASRNALFDTRLSPIARLAGASTLSDLVGILRKDEPAHLHRAVAEAMTINETSFFRDAKPFETLRNAILPRLIAEKAKERRLAIWSAACSTGQEAYSLAMMIRDSFPELAGWEIRIVGTDISRQVVEYARRGRYKRLEVDRGLPAASLMKHFKRREEEWEVSAALRGMCEFRVINLCAPLPPLPAFDLVLMRNVLLYFTQQDRRTVLGGAHRVMSHEGYLVLGNAEQAEDSTNLFQVEFAGESYFYRPA